MDRRQEIRAFLTSRRVRVTPQQAGIEPVEGVRRVPGLRREEVAHLAGVSRDYYTRLERGALPGASEAVLEAIARALLLNADERSYLIALARGADASRPSPRLSPPQGEIRQSLRSLLEGLRHPAVVRTASLDLLAANEAGRALYRDHFSSPHGPTNIAPFPVPGPSGANVLPRVGNGQRPHHVDAARCAGRGPGGHLAEGTEQRAQRTQHGLPPPVVQP